MLTAYIICACLMFAFLLALGIVTRDERTLLPYGLLINLLASALWPLTLLIQCGMLLLFWRDMQRWKDWTG